MCVCVCVCVCVCACVIIHFIIQLFLTYFFQGVQWRIRHRWPHLSFGRRQYYYRDSLCNRTVGNLQDKWESACTPYFNTKNPYRQQRSSSSSSRWTGVSANKSHHETWPWGIPTVSGCFHTCKGSHSNLRWDLLPQWHHIVTNPATVLCGKLPPHHGRVQLIRQVNRHIQPSRRQPTHLTRRS